MKRCVMVAMLALLLIGSTGILAEASSKRKKVAKPHKVELAYDKPALGTAGNGLALGAPSFATNGTHVFLKAVVKDAVSPAGYADFAWDTDGDTVNDASVTVCGSSSDSVELPPHTTITVNMWALPSPFCAGFSTTGTISIRLSASP